MAMFNTAYAQELKAAKKQIAQLEKRVASLTLKRQTQCRGLTIFDVSQNLY